MKYEIYAVDSKNYGLMYEICLYFATSSYKSCTHYATYQSAERAAKRTGATPMHALPV
jgi:hypothetical protein